MTRVCMIDTDRQTTDKNTRQYQVTVEGVVCSKIPVQSSTYRDKYIGHRVYRSISIEVCRQRVNTGYTDINAGGKFIVGQ